MNASTYDKYILEAAEHGNKKLTKEAIAFLGPELTYKDCPYDPTGFQYGELIDEAEYRNGPCIIKTDVRFSDRDSSDLLSLILKKYFDYVSQIPPREDDEHPNAVRQRNMALPTPPQSMPNEATSVGENEEHE